MNSGTLSISRDNCPSCRFRIPQQGGRVIWQITNRCNYRCCYCIFGSTAASSRELSTRRALTALAALKAANFSHVKITGGEPFLRKDLAVILRKAVELGFTVDVSTNASLVTAASARDLASAGVQLVHVSLDGDCAKLHDRLRGQGTFLKTLRGLTFLLQAGMRLRVGCVVWRGNERRLASMAEFCERLTVHELAFSLLEPGGRLPRTTRLLARLPRAELLERIEELRRRLGRRLLLQHNFQQPAAENSGSCPGALQFIYIDHLGRLAPCTWVADREPRFRTSGTLSAASLTALLHSNEFVAYRALLSERETHGCYGCPIQSR